VNCMLQCALLMSVNDHTHSGQPAASCALHSSLIGIVLNANNQRARLCVCPASVNSVGIDSDSFQ
jgi:hypothetical protein